MKHEISRTLLDTMIITIDDDEPNSADKEALLDLILNQFRNELGSWGQRFVNSDNVKYAIHKQIWDNKEFQKKYLRLILSL